MKRSVADHFEAAHGCRGAAEAVGLDAKALEHADKERGDGGVLRGIELQVLAVFEGASGEDEGETAVENDECPMTNDEIASEAMARNPPLGIGALVFIRHSSFVIVIGTTLRQVGPMRSSSTMRGLLPVLESITRSSTALCLRPRVLVCQVAGSA